MRAKTPFSPWKFLACAAILAAAFCAAPASANGEPTDDDDEARSEIAAPRWKVESGAGAALRPLRRGDSRYIFSPFPIAKVSYGELFEASSRDGLSYAVLSGESFRMGPQFEIDRKERQSTKRLGPASTILGTGGVGTFAEWKLPEETRIRLDLTRGVFGQEGFRVVLSGAQSFSLSAPLTLDLGLKGAGGDRRYVTSAYGIPESRRAEFQSAIVPTLRHGSAGATAFGPTLGVSYSASAQDSVAANIEASRVLGTASHTPAVRSLGTRNAMSLELSWRRTLYESR